MTNNRVIDDRTLKDDYPIEGLRGKKWDLSGVLKLLAGIYNASPPTLKDGEAGFVQLTSEGKVIVDLEALDLGAIINGTLTRTVINHAEVGAGTTEIVAAGTNSLYVVACFIMADAEVGMTINSDTVATKLTGVMPISSRSGFILPSWYGTTGGWLKGDAAKNLTITLSGAADVDGFIVTRDLV